MKTLVLLFCLLGIAESCSSNIRIQTTNEEQIESMISVDNLLHYYSFLLCSVAKFKMPIDSFVLGQIKILDKSNNIMEKYGAPRTIVKKVMGVNSREYTYMFYDNLSFTIVDDHVFSITLTRKDISIGYGIHCGMNMDDLKVLFKDISFSTNRNGKIEIMSSPESYVRCVLMIVENQIVAIRISDAA